MLALHRVKVVNDMVSSAAGMGDDPTPAQAVVKTIRAMGGEAVVDISDMSDWKGSKAMIDKAVESFGGLDIRVKQRRHPARPHVDQ